MKSSLTIENLSFAYKSTPVISNFSLSVEAGSFTTLLGSSGCGKTTLLRLISGFLQPQGGSILIDGVNQNGILPNKRRIAMVFQDYALFPHLTVQQNLLYGLSLGKKTREQKQQNRELVQRTAESLGIQNLLGRFPTELSGGQQQRVALGRALVLEPSLLLMDEPLSSLDTNLRIHVREELREIQQKLGITTVYVTHDQEEALSISDSIAIINGGSLVQHGSPRSIYFEPADAFTAAFVGRANFIEEGAKTLLVRPEWITLSSQPSPTSRAGIILSKEFLGSVIRCKINANGIPLSADYPSSCTAEFPVDSTVHLSFSRTWTLPN